MLNPKHRNKLIDGIVVAMSAPKGMRPKYGVSKDGEEKDDTAEEREEDMPEPEMGEDVEYARDAARALGMDDIDDKQAKAFAAAIKSICEGVTK